jgi:small GTP-binding protein
MMVNGQPSFIEIWDTSGHTQFDEIRFLCFSECDVFILCFAIDNRESFENVFSKWIPEAKKHNPSTPFVICATKLDLRQKSHHDVSQKEAIEKSKASGASAYLECSAQTQVGLKPSFQNIVRIALNMELEDIQERSGRKCCTIL